MSKIFNQVRRQRPGRSVFNLSYEKKFDGDMGLLYPVMCDEMVPGDSFTIGNEIVMRMQPLVAPIMHEINAYVHYFFVPYRILDDNFEEFISDPEGALPLPKWQPTKNGKHTLWDMLGFPTGVNPVGAYPLDFPRRAYNMIWNEYYRDQNLQQEVSLDNEDILRRSWEKDYFTSSLPWQQKGTAPALPISGITSARWEDLAFVSGSTGSSTENIYMPAIGDSNQIFVYSATNQNQAKTNAKNFFNNNKVDFGDAATFNVSDLRLAFQVQKWLERNARCGTRYTEFLQSHFGVSPRDERLQRPEYVGGSKSRMVVSEVLQTSSTDASSPQGNLAGHGILVGQQFVGKYYAQEYGVMVGLLSIMPRAAYQQGIDRQWLKDTLYDFYFPEFANLSEQAIKQAEIYASGSSSENNAVFGYQGRYNEMRYKRNQVCGNLRDTFDYWHLGRKFSTAPLLNDSFLQCNPDKRIFAVPSEPGLIITFGNLIKAVRPIPGNPEPGFIDHN